VKDALRKERKENWLFQGDIWTPATQRQVPPTACAIEDEGAFTTPWTATLTYAPWPD